MPEQKRPLKVFLCHAHVDKDAAKALYDRLAQDGVDAWLDKEKLFAGANWEFEIRKAVRECDIFVVCVSEQFTQRFRRKNFAQTEVGIALNEAELKPKDQIYIIPVRLENCAVPKSLQRWHWVDLFEPDGYQRLIRSLNKRIEELRHVESGQGQAGQPNISVVVSGDVSGNLIIGPDNAIHQSVNQSTLQKNRKVPSISWKPSDVHHDGQPYISIDITSKENHLLKCYCYIKSVELNGVIRDDIKQDIAKHTNRVSWSGGSDEGIGVKHIDPMGFGRINLASLDIKDFIRLPLQFETAKGSLKKDGSGSLLPIGRYTIVLGLACATDNADFDEIPIIVKFEYVEQYRYFADSRIRGQAKDRILRLLEREMSVSSLPDEKKSSSIDPAANNLTQDEKTFTFIRQEVHETIQHVKNWDDFRSHLYSDVRPLYRLMENSHNPDLFFVNEELEKKKNKFFDSNREFCNTLIALTQTDEPDAPKQIIYDDLDEPEKFENARQQLNQLADKVVRSYTTLYQTYIKITETPEKNFDNFEKSPQTLKPEHKVAITVAIIGAIATLFAALIGILPQFFSPAPVPTTTNTPTPTATETFTRVPAETFTNLPPSKTPVPSLTPAQTFTPTPTPLLTEITDPKGVSMRLVPAGEFIMGSNNHSEYEKPAHIVYVNDFYIDVYEVTNALYKTCADAGACIPPATQKSSTRDKYYSNPEFDNYPVVYVNWNQAKTYCEWRGARLPSEAEWQKAARGTGEFFYPWGNEGIENRFANYGSLVGDTSEVGSYPDGMSQYGMYDIAGNVWEWVDDWYDAYPGNTVGHPDYGTTYRVLRGGSWNNSVNFLRVSYRLRGAPGNSNHDIGFRCARSP